MSVEGRSRSYSETYEPRINRLGKFGLRGSAFASLAYNDGLTTISNRASPLTPAVLGAHRLRPHPPAMHKPL